MSLDAQLRDFERACDRLTGGPDEQEPKRKPSADDYEPPDEREPEPK